MPYALCEERETESNRMDIKSNTAKKYNETHGDDALRDSHLRRVQDVRSRGPLSDAARSSLALKSAKSKSAVLGLGPVDFSIQLPGKPDANGALGRSKESFVQRGRGKHLASIRTRARSAATTVTTPLGHPKRPKLGNQATHTQNSDTLDEVFKKLDQETKEADTKADYATARKSENRPKNRYGNILASESTRVKLCALPNEETTDDDYINANHVTAHNVHYIATQGPLPSTVDDFWHMVWQENVSMIVMLTPLIEKDTPKCARYYPHKSKKFAQFGGFTVTLLSKETAAYDIKIRKLCLERGPDEPRRALLHVQYSAWPDFGLPTAGTQGFRECIHLVDKLSAELEKERQSNGDNRGPGPIVVHCSAGVGRSGTFCTVHSILHHLEELMSAGKPIPDVGELINQTVRRIREQRAGMVQTKDQYSFCYKAVVDAIQSTGEAPKM